MSNADAMRPGPQPTMAPLSWPPPGLEKLQGLLWRATLISWAGSVILVLPLLWALAVEQRFYSLGPFEENWQVGMGIALLGGIIILFSFGIFFGLMRASARAQVPASTRRRRRRAAPRLPCHSRRSRRAIWSSPVSCLR